MNQLVEVFNFIFKVIAANNMNVRMAERSKAPDSREIFSDSEISGPLMWAWVQIPLLTREFLNFNETNFLIFFLFQNFNNLIRINFS